jgi:hypothetical protein
MGAGSGLFCSAGPAFFLSLRFVTIEKDDKEDEEDEGELDP